VTTQAQVRTEVVWFNFAPDRVHWASYAGRNFTDRQRIKRKAANWGRRYKAMPAGERLAVLAAIMAVEADEGSWQYRAGTRTSLPTTRPSRARRIFSPHAPSQ